MFEVQKEPLNDRSYYVGTVYVSYAIGFSDCGDWMIQSTSSRSVKLQISEKLGCTADLP